AAGATAESLKVFWPDGKWHTYPGPILPGTLEVIDDTRAPVITTISTPEELSPPGVDIFYATVRVEDDSPIEWVLASLATVEYIETSWGSTATVIGTCDSPDDSATIHCVETSAPGIYRVGLPAPAPGDSLMYFFIARDIFGNTGCLPETPGRFGSSLFKLKVYASQSKGDINQDGKTDILDLVRLIAIINATGEPPGEEEFDAADLDGNGNIDIFDLLGLINILQSGRALSAGDELPVLTPTKDR
ncbi:MAG: dockerin type I domain-containing protein, partial [Gemmatimonadota bacterium]|nr:dockerin type I domain-containing protein [Gemmatimonadota bacterium]